MKILSGLGPRVYFALPRTKLIVYRIKEILETHLFDSVDPICTYYNSGLRASEKVLRRPDKTDVRPLLNASAKHSLFFKRCLGRTGILHLPVSTKHGS